MTSYRMFVVSTILAVLLVVSSVSCTEYGRILADPGHGEIIALDIALDRESMTVFPGTPDPPQTNFKQSVNFHVFKRGLVAIKIVDEGVCYIKPSSETYKDVAQRLHNKEPQPPIKQVTEECPIDKDVIKPAAVGSKFGSLIANFCTGYNVSAIGDGHVMKDVARAEEDKAPIVICLLCTCTVKAEKEMTAVKLHQ